MAYNSGYWEELERSLRKQLAEAQTENAALVAEFQRLADEPPTLEEIAADLDKIEMLEKELAEAQTEVERLALEIENQQYTITCASEENQQLKESLAEARAEIERLKAPALNASLLREKLAELAHDQWAGWMEYLFFKSKQVDGCVIIPAWANERWRRQVATRYADLSEEEKDSDRSEADKFLAVFNAQLAEAQAEIERLKEWEYCMKTQAPYEAAGATWELRHKHDQAVIAERDKLIEQMRDALKALKQQHYVNDDDNWYSCPASGLCSNDNAGTDCNCGADHVNSIIQAALRAADGGE